MPHAFLIRATLCAALSFPTLASAGGLVVGAGAGTASFQGEWMLEPAYRPHRRFDERQGAHEAFVGWRFNRYLTVELGYQNLGVGVEEFELDPDIATLVPVATRQAIDVRSLSLSVLAEYPLGERLGVFAMAGHARHDARIEWLDGITLPAGTDARVAEGRDSNATWGLGLRYALRDRLSLRLHWRGSRLGLEADARRYDVNYVGIAAQWRFGGA